MHHGTGKNCDTSRPYLTKMGRGESGPTSVLSGQSVSSTTRLFLVYPHLYDILVCHNLYGILVRYYLYDILVRYYLWDILVRNYLNDILVCHYLMTFWFIPISMTYQTDSVTWPGHVFSLDCSQPDLARWGGREPVDVSCPVCVRICHNKSHCDDIVLHCDHSHRAHSFLFRNSSQKVSLSSDTVMSSLKLRV